MASLPSLGQETRVFGEVLHAERVTANVPPRSTCIWEQGCKEGLRDGHPGRNGVLKALQVRNGVK